MSDTTPTVGEAFLKIQDALNLFPRETWDLEVTSPEAKALILEHKGKLSKMLKALRTVVPTSYVHLKDAVVATGAACERQDGEVVFVP